MLAQDLKSSLVESPPGDAPVVIVGSGPVGMRMAQELLQRRPELPVVIYGDEPWEPYDRVRLSAFLAGDLQWPALVTTLVLPMNSRLIQRQNCRVIAVDREACYVVDADGRHQPYSALVLATGSYPHVPAIDGIERRGVYTFRDMNDAQRLLARRTRSRHTLVVGGGLLGLEAARAMQRAHTQVSVIDHEPRLMARQLDGEAAELLRERVMALGIRVYLSDGIKQVLGNEWVEGVRLHTGREIACDTIVLATGIRPNIGLARAAWLAVGRGIKVDDHMRTSDPRIYAVGECAEHRGKVYGLVAPGFEQAAVAAHALVGGRSRYTGSIAATRLKVVGVPVFSTGVVDTDCERPACQVRQFNDAAHGVYRRVILRRGRLLGALAVGEWPEATRVQEAVQTGRRVYAWQLRRFQRSGRLWWRDDAQRVAAWPASTKVCQCTGVTRGALSAAIDEGCHSLAALAGRTGATRVCGSCRPLVQELLGAPVAAAPTLRPGLLAVGVAAALAVAVVAAVPPLAVSTSVDGDGVLQRLWLDGFWKQVTGFSLAGLALVGLTVSLRKRWRRFTAGAFTHWRMAHSILGVLMIGLLAVHTGMHAGANLNFVLLLCFLGVTVAGGLAAAAAALEHVVGAATGGRLRAWANRAHLYFAWPLPVLVGAHIVSVYYF